MKVTLLALVQAEGAMHALSQQKLPFDVAYQVSKLCRKAKGPIEDFKKAEYALITEYGTPTVEGVEGPMAQYTISKEKLEEFTAKRQTLYDTEENMEVKPVKATQLASLTIEPGVLTPLFDWFIEDDIG